MAPYNDIDGDAAADRAARRDLAAILVEPMMGGGGCIPADALFLAALRARGNHASARC